MASASWDVEEDSQDWLSHFESESASGDRSCVLLDGSEQRIVPEAKRLAKEEAGEREGTPHPPVFSVRVANKGLMLDAASRLADMEFEVAGFSMICCGEVRGVTSCKTLGFGEGYPPPVFV